MLVEDQRDVIDFLSSSDAHGSASVERIETHASVVVLAGERAWKLKRAVRYDYLDFSTADRRKAMCEAEVRINRRTAPDIYLGVVPITVDERGQFAINGTGRPVDWLVEMRRFDQEQLFDRLAERGELTIAMARRLATRIARFHLDAEPRRDHGGRPGMRWVVDGNARGFTDEGGGMLDQAAAADLTSASRREIDRLGAVLDDRRANGFVRQCHGDLHLRNIVGIQGEPVLFDAIEFNDEIACTDVLYDLAFLLMDLWRRRLPAHANVVLNQYLADTRDLAAVALLPLFLSCRAAVRAKTSASAARLQDDTAASAQYVELARAYLAMASALIQPPRPVLVAVGGFSGSGKSTLALSLAPHIGGVPGAVVLRTDEIRKRLLGVSPLTRLGSEAYSADVSTRVYEQLQAQARTLLDAGHAVIADAVFARAKDRRDIEKAAELSGVPFLGLWLDLDEAQLRRRVAERGADVSDADPDVVREQVAVGAGPMTWRRLDGSQSPEDVSRRAINLIRESEGAGGPPRHA